MTSIDSLFEGVSHPSSTGEATIRSRLLFHLGRVVTSSLTGEPPDLSFRSHLCCRPRKTICRGVSRLSRLTTYLGIVLMLVKSRCSVSQTADCHAMDRPA